MNPSPTRTSERAFDFLRINQRPGKPRKVGVTEIRGPYYTAHGKCHVQDGMPSRTSER